MPAPTRAQKKKPAKRPVCAAATQIVQAAVREDCSAADLGRLAQGDPAFAMRVLSVVNSPAFQLARKVSDVQQAASLLGVRGLRNLALSLVVSDMVPVGEAGLYLLANGLRRAIAARLAARALGEKQTDRFFTAGLFLDAGLLLQSGDDVDVAVELARSPAAHRPVQEKAAGREPHPVTGARLAEQYMLPEETIEAIAKHHDPEPPEQITARVAWLAERVAGVFEGGNIVATQAEAIRAGGVLGLSEESIQEILRELPAQVEEAGRAFDRDVGPQQDVDTLVMDATRQLAEMNEHYEGIVRTLRAVIAEKESLEQQLRAANSELAQLATTDALTGLPNKRALKEALQRDLARADRQGTPLSLVVVDVDHFKKFNDTWGHATGDEVLKAVGQLILNSIRTGDVPARFGGEEFVLILPNTDAAGAHVVGERLRSRLEALTVPGPQGELHVTASFGIATVQGPGCGGAADSLFERADAALYEAKRGGRNRVAMAA